MLTMIDKRKHVVSTKLTDSENRQLMEIIEEEHYVGKSALLYMIVADYLRSKRLERSGHRIVYESVVEPHKPQ